MCKSSSGTSIDENDTVWVNVRYVHRRALHFWVGKSHLHVNVVDALQKVAEITTGGFDRAIVTAIDETLMRNIVCFFCFFLFI